MNRSEEAERWLAQELQLNDPQELDHNPQEEHSNVDPFSRYFQSSGTDFMDMIQEPINQDAQVIDPDANVYDVEEQEYQEYGYEEYSDMYPYETQDYVNTGTQMEHEHTSHKSQNSIQFQSITIAEETDEGAGYVSGDSEQIEPLYEEERKYVDQEIEEQSNAMGHDASNLFNASEVEQSETSTDLKSKDLRDDSQQFETLNESKEEYEHQESLENSASNITEELKSNNLIYALEKGNSKDSSSSGENIDLDVAHLDPSIVKSLYAEGELLKQSIESEKLMLLKQIQDLQLAKFNFSEKVIFNHAKIFIRLSFIRSHSQ